MPVLALSFVGLVTRRPWLWLYPWGREGLPDQESQGARPASL